MSEDRIVSLDHENSPEWFYLDFLPVDPPCILIGIAHPPLRWLKENLAKYRIREMCEKRLGEEFLADYHQPWGFGGILVPYKHKPGAPFLEYTITIPPFETLTEQKCSECKGRGKRDGMNCLYCDGVGKKMERDWTRVNRVAATLMVLGAIIDKPLMA